jgi:hypothetical protein
MVLSATGAVLNKHPNNRFATGSLFAAQSERSTARVV